MEKIVASCFGIGYIQKGAGSVAALFCCGVWYLFKAPQSSWEVDAIVILIIFLVGVYTAAKAEGEWGHDSNKIVIDEVLGMTMALFLVPVDWRYMLLAFVLFRFFDIAKPLGVRTMERFPGGWGVMMDDLLAGIYSNVLLQIIVKSHLFS